MKYQRVQVRNFEKVDGEYFFDALDVRAIESALRLAAIPVSEWKEYYELALFMFAIEQGAVAREDWPLDGE